MEKQIVLFLILFFLMLCKRITFYTKNILSAFYDILVGQNTSFKIDLELELKN